jgi:hypothetical protein
MECIFDGKTSTWFKNILICAEKADLKCLGVSVHKQGLVFQAPDANMTSLCRIQMAATDMILYKVSGLDHFYLNVPVFARLFRLCTGTQTSWRVSVDYIHFQVGHTQHRVPQIEYNMDDPDIPEIEFNLGIPVIPREGTLTIPATLEVIKVSACETICLTLSDDKLDLLCKEGSEGIESTAIMATTTIIPSEENVTYDIQSKLFTLYMKLVSHMDNIRCCLKKDESIPFGISGSAPGKQGCEFMVYIAPRIAD